MLFRQLRSQMRSGAHGGAVEEEATAALLDAAAAADWREGKATGRFVLDEVRRYIVPEVGSKHFGKAALGPAVLDAAGRWLASAAARARVRPAA